MNEPENVIDQTINLSSILLISNSDDSWPNGDAAGNGVPAVHSVLRISGWEVATVVAGGDFGSCSFVTMLARDLSFHHPYTIFDMCSQ